MTRIRELREMRGVQQKELSIDLGVSQPTVSDWESGRKQPSSKSAAKIADYFEVSIDYLLGRVDTLNLGKEKSSHLHMQMANHEKDGIVSMSAQSERDDLRLIEEYMRTIADAYLGTGGSVESLAKEMNIDVDTLCRWFTGNSKLWNTFPTGEIIKKILDVTDTGDIVNQIMIMYIAAKEEAVFKANATVV